VSIYLDASVLVALFTDDPFSARADTLLSKNPVAAFISDFAAIEFASAVSRRVRMRELTLPHAQIAFANFDGWIERVVQRLQMTAEDVATAETFLRRLDLNLRTQDALHIAMTKRIGTTLMTFDKSMAAAARALKISVVGA
jgi:predicted nucleic acid-binding protein